MARANPPQSSCQSTCWHFHHNPNCGYLPIYNKYISFVYYKFIIIYNKYLPFFHNKKHHMRA